ncbi:MAG: E3 binding domain-containing protein [Myxococcales bacterium]|nr:E3 binding domain-containing protein [Myxococcales bacterium]
MATNVIMPQMGESVAEGTITVWLKKVGDEVDRDEPIFEITTDKVDAEIPSPAAGVLLEIKVAAGETVEVGTVVAVIGSAAEAGASAPAPAAAAPAAAPAEAAAPAAAAPAAAPAPAAVDKPRSELSAAELRRLRSTPVVRKIASEHGVDIQAIAGSGLDGRVTRSDIEAYIASSAAAPAAPLRRPPRRRRRPRGGAGPPAAAPRARSAWACPWCRWSCARATRASA